AYCSGIAGYLLNSKERESLQKCYWLVLRPLYSYLKDQSFFNGFVLLQTAFQEALSHAKPEEFKVMISHLATHLVKTEVSFDDHLGYLTKLSQQASTEPLREVYFQTLEKY